MDASQRNFALGESEYLQTEVQAVRQSTGERNCFDGRGLGIVANRMPTPVMCGCFAGCPFSDRHYEREHRKR
jgi:hypothetical protein